MPEVHLPHVDDEHEGHEPAPTIPLPARPRGRSIFKLALEVLLIATGVFLGLAGEQWRETRRDRELDVYTDQQQYQTIENTMMNSAYGPTSFTSDLEGFLTSVATIYLADVIQTEPRLLKQYDALLPRLEAAKGK